MAKTLIIGEVTTPTKKLKPIVFEKILMGAMVVSGCQAGNISLTPNYYAFVELICKNYGYSGNTDLMFAYQKPNERYRGVLFIGAWNDGVTE